MARYGYPHQRGHIPEDELLSHRLGQCAAQHPHGLVHGPVRRDLVAALTDCAALWNRASGILALEAARAPDAKRVHPDLDVTHHQLVELSVPDVGDDVEPREHLVVGGRGRRQAAHSLIKGLARTDSARNRLRWTSQQVRLRGVQRRALSQRASRPMTTARICDATSARAAFIRRWG